MKLSLILENINQYSFKMSKHGDEVILNRDPNGSLKVETVNELDRALAEFGLIRNTHIGHNIDIDVPIICVRVPEGWSHYENAIFTKRTKKYPDQVATELERGRFWLLSFIGGREEDGSWQVYTGPKSDILDLSEKVKSKKLRKFESDQWLDNH